MFEKVTLLLRNQVEVISFLLEELYILRVRIILICLIILQDYYELKIRKYGILDMYFILCLQIIGVVERGCLRIKLREFII